MTLLGAPLMVRWLGKLAPISSGGATTMITNIKQTQLISEKYSTLRFFIYLCAKNLKKRTIMARPIKETPILTGKDAERFVKRMNEKRTVSEKEIERVRKNYEYVLSIAKF